MLTAMSRVKPQVAEASQSTRRQRVRAAASAEILGSARELLVAGGTESVTLRGIAGSLGMTAPALYRYFASRERLLGALIDDLYTELAQQLQAARDADPTAVLKTRFLDTSFAFRRWALDHRPEFGLLFGAPIPGVPDPAEREAAGRNRGQAFGQVWLDLFVELWRQHPEVVPSDEDVPADLRKQLADYHRQTGALVPIGAIALYLGCWMRLYGAVATEAFGHLNFALRDGDAEALFRDLMHEMAARLGLKH